MLVPFFYSRIFWMALSLRSSAANTSIIILGWRFHFVQAQQIQKEFIRMSLSQSESDILSYWAYPKPFKNISGAFQLLSV
jgi:hypothetical protein